MEFHKAKLEDIEQLSRLFHSYRQLSVSLDNSFSLSDSTKWIEDRLSEDNAVFLIAESEQEILGFVTLYQGFSSISLSKYWILNDLFVSKDARGLGLGRSLMEQAEMYASATKSKGIELETSKDNLLAQSLYKDLGYIENERYKSYFKKVQL
ncbi:GNAT family N-acetyltransferase [Vibrio splendidus]|uniref:GNAT family N-acetyltransferase n=1 Tax=Vibrio splendidus TaxID=29497 RepID=A0A2N7FJL8_VIBSP|nr:GNAT family N-acetyltransferase [Vibrio splendidus]PMJ69475.1 GNAT family N-acetyltransferase [Vibrio splendidus]